MFTAEWQACGLGLLSTQRYASHPPVLPLPCFSLPFPPALPTCPAHLPCPPVLPCAPLHAEAMFKPLEDTVALLARFGDQTEPELVQQLEDGPRQWRLLFKKMFRHAFPCKLPLPLPPIALNSCFNCLQTKPGGSRQHV